jgi:hypothetical protein
VAGLGQGLDQIIPRAVVGGGAAVGDRQDGDLERDEFAVAAPRTPIGVMPSFP